MTYSTSTRTAVICFLMFVYFDCSLLLCSLLLFFSVFFFVCGQIGVLLLGRLQPVQGFNPVRTAVPCWGQSTYNLTGLSPKRDCRPMSADFFLFEVGVRFVPAMMRISLFFVFFFPWVTAVFFRSSVLEPVF